MNPKEPSGALFMVLLVDDLEQQWIRIRDRLASFRVRVEWRRSYHAAADLLKDPDAGPHIDLVLIDQAFDVDEVPDEDLLTATEIAPFERPWGWDVRLHQGLFIMARLRQDMRDGVLPFTRTMILAHNIDMARSVFGNLSATKRQMLTDPCGTLAPHLPGLRDGSIRRLPAVVVADEIDVHDDAVRAPCQVVMQEETIVELRRLSRSLGSASGVDTARHLPGPAAETCSRALPWTATPVGPEFVLRQTWRTRWSEESWRRLLRTLTGATEAMLTLEDASRPLPLTALRVYDDDGAPVDIESEPPAIARVEYGVRVPDSAQPLASWYPRPESCAECRRMAGELLRSQVEWERSRLVYLSMEPTGIVRAGGRLYCDLLESVVPAGPQARARQRRGAAASLVFLLSRWPFRWEEVLVGAPAMLERAGEWSAWGIAAVAVAALLDPFVCAERLTAVLEERATLLDAAALLDDRFPAWPMGAEAEFRP